MNITVYLGSNKGNKPLYEEKIRELGAWIGSEGHTLVYGGSRAGLMGILADSVLEAGGHVVGIEPQMFIDIVAQHEGIDELIVTKDMSERKAKLIEMGDVFIAFPGGTGTLEEISEVMSRTSLQLGTQPCIVYNLEGYYDHLEAMLDHMVEEGFLPKPNRDRMLFLKSLDEIKAKLG